MKKLLLLALVLISFISGAQKTSKYYFRDNAGKNFSELDLKQLGINISDVDGNDRVSLNTVFGEKIFGIRKNDIAAQFQYGFPNYDANLDTANGGYISISNSLLIANTGVRDSGRVRISNKKALRYIPGHEAYIYFTVVFDEPKDSSFQRAGLFDSYNGFFLGYEGKQFTITRRRDSINYKVPINLNNVFLGFNPTKGNVYKISYGYLGFATINFEVMKPNGSFTLIHKIQFPNTDTLSHITNTNLPPSLEVGNFGNNTNISAKTASFTAGLVNGGGTDPTSRPFSLALSNQSITAGIDTVITLRSMETFNSLINYIETEISLISASTDLSKISTWEIRKNMTITNTPTWTKVDSLNSTIEYSTNATITDGTGILLLPYTMSKTDRFFEEIEKLKVQIFPNETITILIRTGIGTTGTYNIALRWNELF